MKRPDWSRIIFLLMKETGLSVRAIAGKIGVPYTTVQSWKNEDHEPRFTPGLALIEYFVITCGDEIPYIGAGK